MERMKEYKQFNCRDVGTECDFMVRAETEEEVLGHCYGHVGGKHGQCVVSPSIEERFKLSIKNVWVGSGRFLEG